MKCTTAWNHTPYRPADLPEERMKPFICRLAPGETTLEIEWFDHSETGTHTLFWSQWLHNKWQQLPVEEGVVTLTGLKDGAEYEFYIQSPSGKKSATRLAHTGFVPGTVVNYLHPQDKFYAFSGNYLCSPSLVRVPSGALLAMMDVYGSSPQNLQIICRSDDDGKTWHYLTELFPSFWGTLFLHKGALYCISASTEYGDLLIGRSDDEGKTWTRPTVLARGSSHFGENGWHRAPVVVLNAYGRLWTGMDYGSWAKEKFSKESFSNTMFSIDENADLLVAENWHYADFWHYDGTLPGAVPNVNQGIEDNAVVGPDGNLYLIERYAEGKAIKLRLEDNDPDKAMVFDQFIDFPMAHTKFEIRRRESDGLYFAVGNRPPLRTVLSVYVSEDLEHWEFLQDILNYEDMPHLQIGFQYPAFLFNGDHEILVLSRTSFNGANNFHDSNFQTFHRVTLLR